jgi:hypothetical protein
MSTTKPTPTTEHVEEARRIAEQFSLDKCILTEPPTFRQYHFDVEELINTIATALATRGACMTETEATPRRCPTCDCDGTIEGHSGRVLVARIAELEKALREIIELRHQDWCDSLHQENAPCDCHISIARAALTQAEKE